MSGLKVVSPFSRNSRSPPHMTPIMSPPSDPLIIVQFLKSSRKAQVPYFTGWDTKPNSSLKLLGEVENDENLRKQAVLDRAFNVFEYSQQKEEAKRRRDSKEEAIALKAKVSEPPEPKLRSQRKSWPASSSSIVCQVAESTQQLQKHIEEHERRRFEKWIEGVREEIEEKKRTELTQDQVMTSLLSEQISKHNQVRLKLVDRRRELKSKLEQRQRLQQLEIEQEDKKIEEDRKLKLFEDERRQHETKLEKEKEEAAATEKREKERLQLIKDAEDKIRKDKEAAETKALLEKQAQEAKAKELQQQQIQQASKAPSSLGSILPAEFQNSVIPSDLSLYLKSQQQLEEIKQSIQHISSSNPQTKGFYFAAMKVVNTPINSISNLSDEHLQQKIRHFNLLFEGKPVYIGDTMTAPFMTSNEQHGDIFVLNLFAHRFVKKSEAEITRGQSGIAPLAVLGVQILRRFPKLGPIIKANLYKMCPFLVPFVYPRNENMTNEQYASVLGHEKIGGTERTIQQVLLERLTAYCTLLGNMVNIAEKNQFNDLGPENLEFFSLKEVWRILSTTLRLEPQVDVTCTVLHALLETCCDYLLLKFKSQFRKIMIELSINYLQKVRKITPPDRSASLARLELLLESKSHILR